MPLSTITVSGQFTTDDEVMLSFKTTGIIDKIYVKEGDAIQKGQLLATLNLTEIDASLQQAQLAFEKSNRDLPAHDQSVNDSVATLEQVQNAKTAMDLAAQQMNTAHALTVAIPKSGLKPMDLYYVNWPMKVSLSIRVIRYLQTNGAGSAQWILRAGVTDKQWMAI